MKEFAHLTDRARKAIDEQNADELGEAINANFDLRQKICPLHPGHVEMVQLARQAGATAKFAGSGGAIVGTYPDPETLSRLTTELATIGCRVVRPVITNRLHYPEWLEPDSDATQPSPTRRDNTQSLPRGSD